MRLSPSHKCKASDTQRVGNGSKHRNASVMDQYKETRVKYRTGKRNKEIEENTLTRIHKRMVTQRLTPQARTMVNVLDAHQ